MFDRSSKKRIRFSDFLTGEYMRDQILQDIPYAEQVRRAVKLLREADYVLLGAGAGMSAAAGAQYGGEFFEQNFAEFQKAYGKGPYMQDMYSAGFYPFPDEEARWGYWSHVALLAGIDLDVTPLHRTILEALACKKIFLLSTNVDGQFEKAGLPAEQIFATQGSYRLIQCARACHNRTYDAVDMFRQMDQARKNARIPGYMVPHCPVCGGKMNMNLRSDDYFVQDENWYAAEARFGSFLSACLDKKTVLLELGVGFNTPAIIRLPFEKLAREHENICLIRLSRSKAMVPAGLGGRAVGIAADMAQSISDIASGLKSR